MANDSQISGVNVILLMLHGGCNVMIHLYISGLWIWIGAWDKYNNDVFYWLDGTPVSNGYTNWNRASGEPDEGSDNYVL